MTGDAQRLKLPETKGSEQWISIQKQIWLNNNKLVTITHISTKFYTKAKNNVMETISSS